MFALLQKVVYPVGFLSAFTAAAGGSNTHFASRSAQVVGRKVGLVEMIPGFVVVASEPDGDCGSDQARVELVDESGRVCKFAVMRLRDAVPVEMPHQALRPCGVITTRYAEMFGVMSYACGVL